MNGKQRYSATLTLSLVLTTTATTLVGYTKNGREFLTDGSLANVIAAVAEASAGDTVAIPPGTFVWGTSGASLPLNKAITLRGAGPELTTIELATTGSSLTSGVIRIQAVATIRDFTIRAPANAGYPTAISVNSSDGWRVSNITYDNRSARGYYFIYAGGGYGVIDSCSILTGAGNDEPIFIRGKTNSWQIPSSLGTEQAVYIEDCVFSGPGYVCDVNDNGRAVLRGNLITGSNKIDAHGFASNSTRGARHIEVYNNHWTGVAGFWRTIEIRGGTGMVFNNQCDNRGGVTVNYPSINLIEYGAINKWLNFGGKYQTPRQYPIRDQIGVGTDPAVGGSEPLYLWSNLQAGADHPLSWVSIPAAAFDENGGLPFSMQDIVKADRDYFKHTHGALFDGSSGVGVGTRSQMLEVAGQKVGVGYWVTDEGHWDNTSSYPDGQLYGWDGAAWFLKYTPYSYPHPLRTIGQSAGTPEGPSALKVLSP